MMWAKEHKVVGVKVQSDGILNVECENIIINDDTTTETTADNGSKYCGSFYLLRSFGLGNGPKDILYKYNDEKDEVIVSWENAAFVASPVPEIYSNHHRFIIPISEVFPDYWAPDEYYGNAQVILSSDKIKMCFGEGRIKNMDYLVGYVNYTHTVPWSTNGKFVPADNFGASGYVTHYYPTFACQEFPLSF
mmetsp:Transcript_16941/g.41269  ORF Transcript_16941/g.41269 Transcript_16941/m.41269 type:complete len:191 (+) Transcript_16941:673-1245(+)